MRLLSANGVTRAVLSVAYRGEMIVEYLGDGSQYGIDVSYSFDGPEYLGTAGAIRKALPQLGESFFTLYGDSYLTAPFVDVERVFLESGKQALMTVYRNGGLFDTSNVEFTEGRIVTYDKKALTESMEHIDYGLGVFKATVFAGLAEGERCDLATLYQDVLRRNELAAYEVDERFYEIGTVSGIEDTSRFLAERGL